MLGTSACVTGTGVLVFACLPALEQQRLRVLPLVGIAGSVIWFSLVVVTIWTSVGGDAFGKTAGSVLVAASVGVLASLLSLARLAPRYRPVFPVSLVIAVLLAAMIVGGIWGEPSGSWYPRATGVVAVLLAAVTLAIPIVHRASRSELALAAPEEAGIRFCPSCGAPARPAVAGEAVCGNCGLRFRVAYLPGGVGDGDRAA